MQAIICEANKKVDINEIISITDAKFTRRFIVSTIFSKIYITFKDNKTAYPRYSKEQNEFYIWNIRSPYHKWDENNKIKSKFTFQIMLENLCSIQH